ncbi:hypothetical protein TNIN_140061 [Trichonephila inaurata madagascariensis]|uniref:Uncharacterized protein n=1 Tax=Trichonephila inaurata madagascariensis TaxID=2747483 RepID=A0A8X6WWW8_9ARAC|nr:hypothetical protein TNIN_140061 [Trichonephila inaurata madagascariensis]
MLSRVFQFARQEFVRGFARYPDPLKGPKRISDVIISGIIISPCVVWMAVIFYFGYRQRKEKQELRERQRRALEFSGEETLITPLPRFWF